MSLFRGMFHLFINSTVNSNSNVYLMNRSIFFIGVKFCYSHYTSSRRAEKSRKELRMMRAAKLGQAVARSKARVGQKQEQGRSRAEVGAGQEQGRSKAEQSRALAEAEQELGRSRVGALKAQGRSTVGAGQNHVVFAHQSSSYDISSRLQKLKKSSHGQPLLVGPVSQRIAVVISN